MSKWKKLAGVALAATMVLVTACGNSNKSESSPSSSSAAPSSSAAQTDAGETYEVVMGYPLLGPVPKDQAEVEAAISKITKEKINATVKLLAIPFAQWSQQANLMLTGNEKLDLMLTDFATYGSMVSTKRFAALDDLIAQNGKGIQEALGDKLNAAKIDGKIYAVPVNQLPEGGSALFLRKDLLDQAGVDVSTVKSVDDLDNVFKALKEKNPQMTVLAPNVQGAMPLTTIFDSLGQYDSLLDGLGVLNVNDAGMKVVDLYETPEYAAAMKKLRSWYQAGYLPKGASTIKISNTDQVKSGKAISFVDSDKPASEKKEAAIVGFDVAKVPMQKPLLTTQGVLGLDWAIPANNSRNPAKAMEFLNLMYTDKDIINLINFGIEGKHYTKKSDNVISITGDGYGMHQTFMFGNVHLTYLTDTEDPKSREDGKAFEQTIVNSKAVGFAPNLDAVKTEVAAVKNVTAQYVPALETGSVDPDKVLPQLISKLKAAGIDKIIAEKQKQLDAWLASNGK
ncbi:ABC transporter substrate-binding protein [Cohnella candidum]|uniref:Extracellular solute-binding protein n=1 Tax=Cohnella candidum TaxID=2674991 RepID=A0A3G3JUM8_9BACL|nr:ABC transporter substrate-binding protein [Cohnella candidum]AYQ71551.1 extracellular solute-binding protein [Cohnella candidum]